MWNIWEIGKLSVAGIQSFTAMYRTIQYILNSFFKISIGFKQLMFGNVSFSEQMYVLKFRKKGMAPKNITADGRWKGVIMSWGVTVNLSWNF